MVFVWKMCRGTQCESAVDFSLCCRQTFFDARRLQHRRPSFIFHPSSFMERIAIGELTGGLAFPAGRTVGRVAGQRLRSFVPRAGPLPSVVSLVVESPKPI